MGIPFEPKIGIILGSGLADLVNEAEIIKKIPYSDIEGFPKSTVKGHSGYLTFAKLVGREVVMLEGRFHYYEGYSLQEVTLPVRIMKLLGVETLLLTNASGGVNPDFNIGDVMIIEDHINLQPDNPLRGPNIDELGPRFPDMSEPYAWEFIDRMEQIAKENSLENVQKGVYIALSGPTYETQAEYKMARIIGGDAVGMSTVPEVIVARHMNMRCAALSVITDLGVEGMIEEITHDMVIEAAKKATPVAVQLFKGIIPSI